MNQKYHKLFGMLIAVFIFLSLEACQSNGQDMQAKIEKHPDFGDYWYSGEAELSSYELTQARYGEYRKGTAVLVFVTEPFSRSQQVKLDNPSQAGNDEVTVMKLNMTKQFLTGVYPYSMMTSSFVPVSPDDYSNAIKVTTTSQEWCGHTFTQLNHQNNKTYRLQQFSYFQSEGDVEKTLEAPWLEDELWQRIRIAPESLPTGEITVFPATMYLRLSHRDMTPERANATLEENVEGEYSDQIYSAYRLKYPDRELVIFFETGFPYTILGWEETYRAGFGRGGEMTTKAKRMETITSPYWNKNAVADTVLREQLRLD